MDLSLMRSRINKWASEDAMFICEVVHCGSDRKSSSS